MPIKKMQIPTTEDLQRKTEEVLRNKEYEIACPFCKTVTRAKPGRFVCPSCGKEITLKLQ